MWDWRELGILAWVLLIAYIALWLHAVPSCLLGREVFSGDELRDMAILAPLFYVVFVGSGLLLVSAILMWCARKPKRGLYWRIWIASVAFGLVFWVFYEPLFHSLS